MTIARGYCDLAQHASRLGVEVDELETNPRAGDGEKPGGGACVEAVELLSEASS